MAEYLKIPEVAHRLDVSEKTARRYVKSGTLPSVFIGGAYRVSAGDLEDFLRSARVNPGKEQASPSLELTFNDILDEERRATRPGLEEEPADLDDLSLEELMNLYEAAEVRRDAVARAIVRKGPFTEAELSAKMRQRREAQRAAAQDKGSAAEAG